MVAERARLAVVTLATLGRVGAAAGLYAEILGAGVVVIALHGVADTDPIDTMIGHGAWVTILAFPFQQGDVLAAIFTVALVL